MSPVVHQTYLMVRDVKESVEFYRDVVGLETKDVTEDRAKFDTGECTLVLEEDFDEPVLTEFGLEPPGEERGSGVIIVVEVDDVDAIHERAERADADVRMAPKTVEWGRRMCLVADPNGYVLEISRPTE
jgi:uncharacterized glyoxalase superfamily protein PhnB